jgi:hypothetical protein
VCFFWTCHENLKSYFSNRLNFLWQRIISSIQSPQAEGPPYVGCLFSVANIHSWKLPSHLQPKDGSCCGVMVCLYTVCKKKGLKSLISCGTIKLLNIEEFNMYSSFSKNMIAGHTFWPLAKHIWNLWCLLRGTGLKWNWIKSNKVLHVQRNFRIWRKLTRH